MASKLNHLIQSFSSLSPAQLSVEIKRFEKQNEQHFQLQQQLKDEKRKRDLPSPKTHIKLKVPNTSE